MGSGEIWVEEKSLIRGESDPKRTAGGRTGVLFHGRETGKAENDDAAEIVLRRAKRAKLIYKGSISADDSQDLYESHFILVFI